MGYFQELTLSLVLITMISCLGALQYGYNFWILYSSVLVEEELNQGDLHVSSRHTDPKILLLELTIAIFPTGGILGSLIFAFLVDRFGRKRTMLLNDILSVLCAILLRWFKMINSFSLSFITRFAAGICTGIFSTSVPMYLGEIAPVNLRGTIIEVCLFFMSLGIAVAQAVSLPEFLGNEQGSPVLFGLTGIGALFQLVLLLFLPESPRYLLIQKKQEREAKEVLKKLRGSHYTEDEIEELYQEDQYEQQEKGMRVHRMLCSSRQSWPLRCSIILTVGQQLSGIKAAFQFRKEDFFPFMASLTVPVSHAGILLDLVAYYYRDGVLKSMGIGDENVSRLILGATCLLMMTHIAVICGIDAWGRRILLLCGFGICSISCILLTMTLEIETPISWLPYLSTVLVLILTGAHILGPGSVPIVLTTELFLQSSRSSAYAIVGSVHWFCSCIVTLGFHHIQSYIGPYSFLIFFPFNSVALFYSLMVVPETKRKTFLSIRKLLEMLPSKSLGNKQEANEEAVQESITPSGGRRESRDRKGSLQRDGRSESLQCDGRRQSLRSDGRRESVPRDGRRMSVQRGRMQ
ncbi:solute carrier family 2, facilitated glucose transporter member 5-like isoform X2 [Hemicordylus capensis]|uniref:solute carrier family 2, facilitated glucose transporter member 5-like isoform X2 n=1 Tax=Hemicordylus capensis TaxID=884348 RepID=UPI002303288C|nr:solute carrier family 2, facilitated glucose transporter member 5-like isoform X2 [Hemicordylus capensis]